jgi:hypothetical protein
MEHYKLSIQRIQQKIVAKYLKKISNKNNTLESRMARAYNVSKFCEVMNNKRVNMQ